MCPNTQNYVYRQALSTTNNPNGGLELLIRKNIKFGMSSIFVNTGYVQLYILSTLITQHVSWRNKEQEQIKAAVNRLSSLNKRGVNAYAIQKP